jgi:hypothetical protein
MTTDTAPIKVFYSYAHEDEALRRTLETHLTSTPGSQAFYVVSAGTIRRTELTRW